MRRRDFIAVLSGVAVVRPLAARAQQAGELPIIGYLGPNAASGDRPRIAAFAKRLGELGWVDGRSVVIERRAADGVAERAGESRPNSSASKSVSS